MREKCEDVKSKMGSRANICFDCIHACGGINGCTWSNEWKVPGGAEYELIAYRAEGSRAIEEDERRGYCLLTYRIYKCPMFERG